MVHILVTMHAGDDGIEGLRGYEARVLPILREHGGKLMSAFRPRDHHQPECPDEIHLIEFPSEESFQAYGADPRRSALAADQRRAISKTTVYLSDEIVHYAAP